MKYWISVLSYKVMCLLNRTQWNKIDFLAEDLSVYPLSETGEAFCLVFHFLWTTRPFKKQIYKQFRSTSLTMNSREIN